MEQPNLLDYIKDGMLSELNNRSEKFIENDIEKKNEQVDKSNGIIEIKYGNKIYKSWTVKWIRPLITKYLKMIYPDSLIAREINKVDSTVLDNLSEDIIPVEIQKTPLSSGKNKTFLHTHFEQSIRTQIDINIKIYDKCWLFIDAEYLRYLQYGDVGKNASFDMTWLIKLMNDCTLKVFAINYDGVVKELTTKDFDFLKKLSQTCVIEYDSDNRILNRNKIKIYRNVINGYKFTQEEITQFESEFDNRNDESKISIEYFAKSNNERCKLYGQILHSVMALPIINNVLSCTLNGNHSTWQEIVLGLFYQNDFMGNNKYAQIEFIDKFNIVQYFPGYIRNKEMWDYCKKKQRIFTMNEFRGIIGGTFNYEFIKKQSTMLDY